MNKTCTGFTLIELMIVIAIIAILAAITYPAYSNYIQQSRRTIAKSALMDLASREARYYSTNNVFADVVNLGYSTINIINTINTVPIADTNNYYYNMSVSFSGGIYTASAVPVAGTTQATDACYEYTLNNYGVKANLNSGGSTITGINCW